MYWEKFYLQIHFWTKSTKSLFEVCKNEEIVFELNLISLPKFVITKKCEIPLWVVRVSGLSFSSKNFSLVGDISIMCLGGEPMYSCMLRINSSSFSHGNRGYPVCSSQSIHPNDHMSISTPYGIPSTISGAL